MKIAVFEVESWEREAFQQLEEKHDVAYVREPLDREQAEAHADAEAISTFIYSSLDRDVLERLESLRCIATRSTGVDHIDRELCEARDITVCNVPTYGENTVAEHVFGLLLTISHHLAEAIDRTRKGDFSQEGLRGFDLAGRTMGVIGTGSIGRHTIRIARGFDMGVVAHDAAPDEELAQRLGFEYRGLEGVLREADVVSVHVPATESTKGLIGEAEFGCMKDGVVLINTARGAVVNVTALMKALSDGKVAAAGLDVLPEEPTIREEAELLRTTFQQEHDFRTLLADHVLLRLRNVYITPHSGFNTTEAVRRILDTTVDNLLAFERGDPQNVAWS